MIYTVTLNPALDKTLTTTNLAFGNVNRVSAVRSDPGGKGINVSKCLAVLGGKSVAAVVLGGGTGRIIYDFLSSQQNIEPLAVWTDQETRTNIKICDTTRRGSTDINEPGPSVTERLINDLRDMLFDRVAAGDSVVLAGSLPSGVSANLYRDWANICKEKGVRVLLDADGEALIQGVQALPSLIKPNLHELSVLTSSTPRDRRDVLQMAEPLLKQGIERIVVSMGSEGAFFLTRESSLWAVPVDVPVLSTVGAGDSMVAALAYGTETGMDWIEQARLAMAISSASVMCSGTETPSLSTINSLLEQVHIEVIS